MPKSHQYCTHNSTQRQFESYLGVFSLIRNSLRMRMQGCQLASAKRQARCPPAAAGLTSVPDSMARDFLTHLRNQCRSSRTAGSRRLGLFGTIAVLCQGSGCHIGNVSEQ